jgi:membrane protein DedA with SNARE-associated domain
VLTFLTIVFGTFVSEDLTCIATGLLIARGAIGIADGIAACTTGIFTGDLGLFLVGRVFGGAALGWRWTAARLRGRAASDARAWLERHAAGAIVGSRFLPGTRFALYLSAGLLRLPLAVFALWALVASILWTPTLVLLTATLGDAFVVRMARFAGVGWAARILVGVALLLALRGGRAVASRDGRRRLAARAARWRRWEVWPMAIFYAPVAAWIAVLSLRHRGLATLTAANPGMPDGGTVGESKFDILERLPPDATIPSARVAAGALDDRLAALRAVVDARGWAFPLVLKPDVGQRGVGVKLAHGWDEVATYLSRAAEPVLAQIYHAGPFEAGVFYYRRPGWARGRIFSITDKRFPVIVGDGVSTIETLVWTHPRFRMQGDLFAARHAGVLTRVLAAGERYPLALAGNHAQGTLFLDGAHLVTPALERRIDEIAHAHGGFFIGRFDIRYRDVEAFRAGRDLAIVELNGATAESTNIYDPDHTLLDAYRVLFRQWALVFEIGAANRAAGAGVSTTRRLVDLARRHLAHVPAFLVSD